jgi:type IV secretion system protein VirB2
MVSRGGSLSSVALAFGPQSCFEATREAVRKSRLRNTQLILTRRSTPSRTVPELFRGKTEMASYSDNTKRLLNAMIMCTILCVIALPDMAFAQGFGETGQKVCGFFGSINSILNMSSIAVVTAAVVFAGYQIAFAHKRIADVAPVLVGGVIIGGAGQVAKMVIGTPEGGATACTAPTAYVVHYLLNRYA